MDKNVKILGHKTCRKYFRVFFQKDRKTVHFFNNKGVMNNLKAASLNSIVLCFQSDFAFHMAIDLYPCSEGTTHSTKVISSPGL